MNKIKQTSIIISISSDIGSAMANRWAKKGWKVIGTYRTKSRAVDKLSGIGIELVHCDLSDNNSVKNACSALMDICPTWDNLIIATGTLEPIGYFLNEDFDVWANSIQINFTNQLRIVKELLPTGNMDNKLKPCVLFFAGGSTNTATLNYSAYTISKIALIKMCELLSAEIPDFRFTIVGPGWVRTKIHQATMAAENRAGDNYEKTKLKLAGNDLTPIEDVLDCCDWLINSSHEVISGRNFSTVFDKWGTKELEEELKRNSNMYKLRRHGNDLKTK